MKVPVNMYCVLGRLAAALEKADDSTASIILFPNLLSWYGGNRSRGERSWRAPMMVERFLSILCESAENARLG